MMVACWAWRSTRRASRLAPGTFLSHSFVPSSSAAGLGLVPGDVGEIVEDREVELVDFGQRALELQFAGDDGYFADGVVEDMTTTLPRVRNSFVVARQSAFTCK